MDVRKGGKKGWRNGGTHILSKRSKDKPKSLNHYVIGKTVI